MKSKHRLCVGQFLISDFAVDDGFGEVVKAFVALFLNVFFCEFFSACQFGAFLKHRRDDFFCGLAIGHVVVHALQHSKVGRSAVEEQCVVGVV